MKDQEYSEAFVRNLVRRLPYAARAAIVLLHADWTTARYSVLDTGCYFLWWHFKNTPLCEQRQTGVTKNRGRYEYEYRLTLLGLRVRDMLREEG